MWPGLKINLKKKQVSPPKRIPDATHSKTLRSDSPAPIGLSDVPMAFSTSSSRGYVGMNMHDLITILLHYSKSNLLFSYNNSFLTHPESGAQVGTRLHKSLMIRITTTAEGRLLTLAWTHKGEPVQSEDLQLLKVCFSRKTKAKIDQNDWAISKSPTEQKQPFRAVVELILR